MGGDSTLLQTSGDLCTEYQADFNFCSSKNSEERQFSNNYSPETPPKIWVDIIVQVLNSFRRKKRQNKTMVQFRKMDEKYPLYRKI